MDFLSFDEKQINHLLKIMKVTLLLIWISIFSLNAKEGYSQSARISYSARNTPIENILNEIEKQTEYLFIINSHVDIDKKVSINAKEIPVSKVLDDLFKGTNIHYLMEGSHIILSNKVGETKTDGINQNDKRVTISGKVTDSTGEPLIGVNITLKGTNEGVISDIDGNYSIRIPELSGELTFSYIGYKAMTVAIRKNMINVTLAEDTEVLDEVVVTALGIEKKASSLTYATQKVNGDELTRAKDANFINALQGKTAGLVITPNSTGAGGSSKLLLRGNTSILGNNQPLIILDGVPMADRSTAQIEDALLSGGNSTDGGDGLSNINPDDIADINILKGANAAALYGSKAANGVLIITTKKGQEGRTSVDVSSSMLFETPLVTPKFQNTYGANAEFYDDTSLNPNEAINKRRLNMYSWGDRIGRMSQTALNEIPYARNNAVDNISSFLQTGTNFNNSISVSSGAKNSTSYFSYGNTTSKGMIPQNKFERHNITLRQTVNLLDNHVEVSFSGSYIHQTSKNRPGSGIYANPLYDLYLMPRNADISYFKDHSETYGQLYYVREINGKYPKANAEGPIQQWPWLDNENRNSPYWYANRLQKENVRERAFATIGLKVNIIDGLTALARCKIDRTKDTNETKTYQGTNAKNVYNSIHEYNKATSDQIFADFLVSYNKKVGDFDLSANVGGSTLKEDFTSFGFNYWMADSTSTPNVFDPSNIITTKHDGANVPTSKSKDQNWENAVYATASIGYKDMAFIDASVRTDWARVYTQFSALGTPNHYTYYSVGGNALLNSIFGIQSDILNYSKVRISYSEVGNSIPNLSYGGMSKNWGAQITEASGYRTFYNPLPETMRSTELGVEARFLNNTIDFDLTFYNTIMLNQWLPKSAATGGQIPLNSGKIRNRGFETTLAYNFSRLNGKFIWRTAFNYSFNKNVILKTYGENLNKVMETTPVYTGGLKIRYEVGKPYGELYGRTFAYGSDGKIKTDVNGAPMISSKYDCYLGNANSPHHLGWSNSLNYKNFSFYFLIDGKIGGTVISYTEARLDAYGLSERSGKARDAGVTYLSKSSVGGQLVMKPVQGVVMPDGQIAPAKGYFQAIGLGEPALSEYAYSATNFRLREVSFGYTFRKLFKLPIDLSASLVARNLFFLYKDSPVDPDVSVSTANSYGGIEAFSLPTTRSYGLNLKLSF